MFKVGKLSKGLFQGNKIYNSVLEEVEKGLENLNFSKDIRIERSNIRENFKKNFFSLFMLTLIEFIEKDRKKVIDYGKALYYLRGIITCTDNIIDNEKKGVIFLDGIKEEITENTLLTLVLQRELEDLLNKLDKGKKNLSNKVLGSIYLIAKSEGLRERKLYETYPSYQEVLEKIHSGIGGELLKIGVLVPTTLGEDLRFEKIGEALYNFGLSLQGLDDLCDIKEDYNLGKINLATTYFMERLDIKEEEAKKIDILGEEVRELTEKYLKEIMKFSTKTFIILEELGYPITEKISDKIIGQLFKVRGLEPLWKLIKK